MAMKTDPCNSCGNAIYAYAPEEREALVIAAGVKYLTLIQGLEQAKKVRLSDEEVLMIWELMIDLGVEKIK